MREGETDLWPMPKLIGVALEDSVAWILELALASATAPLLRAALWAWARGHVGTRTLGAERSRAESSRISGGGSGGSPAHSHTSASQIRAAKCVHANNATHET